MVAIQTNRGSAGLFTAIPAHTSCAKTLIAALISLTASAKRSIPFEAGTTERGQQNSRILHAAAIFKSDQAVGDGVFPHRQMRATPTPRFCIRVTARAFCDPGEELLRQCVRGILHEGLNIPASHRFNRRILHQSDPATCRRLTRRTIHHIATTATGTNSAVASEIFTGAPSSCAPFTR